MTSLNLKRYSVNVMYKILLLSFTVIAFAACTSTRKAQAYNSNDYDKALADSVLAYALDHEALYTLADTLKPISSVKFLRYAIAKDFTQGDGDVTVTRKDSLLQKIEALQKVCNTLSGGDWQFVLMPFERTEKNIRNMEIYVVRKSVFEKKLAAYHSFFGQWGFTPATNPSVVLPVVEYESRWDRNRAYGYLFGYPSYAVDFFVEAQKTQDKDTAHKLVTRDFFAIPVFAGNSGYFKFAIPKGQQPFTSDSALYNKAMATLERYKTVRERYVTATGIKAMELWKAMRKVNE